MEIAAAGVGTVLASSLFRLHDRLEPETESGVLPPGPYRTWQGTDQFPIPEEHKQFTAYQVAADGSNYRAISCGSNAHSIQRIPQSNLSIAISRRLSNLSILDWDTLSESHLISLPKGEIFYGHGIPIYERGTFSGKFAVSGAIDDPTTQIRSALIYEVDTKTGHCATLGTLPSHTVHELYPIDEDHYMVGLSGTTLQKPTLGFFNRRSKQFTTLETPLANDPGRGIAHCVRISDDEVVWTSNAGPKETDGPLTDATLLFVNHKTGAIEDFKFQGELAQSELLSIDYDAEAQRLWITFPDVQQLVVFSLLSRKIELATRREDDITYVIVDTVNKRSPIICGSSSSFTAYDRFSLKKLKTFALPVIPGHPRSPHAKWYSEPT